MVEWTAIYKYIKYKIHHQTQLVFTYTCIFIYIYIYIYIYVLLFIEHNRDVSLEKKF